MRCPGCGLEADGDAAAACLARYHELSAQTLSDRDPTFPHQLAVDAYAAQHAEPTNRPINMGTLGGSPSPPAMGRGEQSSPAPHAIKTAFALIGLYLVFE